MPKTQRMGICLWFDNQAKDENSEKSRRAFAAMLQMKKLDIAALKKAYEGSTRQ